MNIFRKIKWRIIKFYSIFILSTFLFMTVPMGCSWLPHPGKVTQAVDALDRAVKQLERGVTTFTEIQEILSDVNKNLNNEVYKRQVEEIIRMTGQVAQISGQAYLDFTRQRIAEDLINIRRVFTGEDPLPRSPVLSNAQSPLIDFRSQGRTALTIVGWNLDIAANDRNKYRVVIENLESGIRTVPDQFVTYQGQYAITLNVSSSGVPLEYKDTRILFEGYAMPFELSVVNSAPPPPPPEPERIIGGRFNIEIYDDDKEVGEVILTLYQGQSEVGRWGYGRGEDWDDPGSRSFEVNNLNIVLNEFPLNMTAVLQEYPGEVNIDTGLRFDLHFYTDRGRDIIFRGEHYYRTPRDSFFSLGNPI